LQVKTIGVGESVGYEAKFIAQRETRLAIVVGGYADGLLRSLRSSGFAYCQGCKVPVIGQVSMDSIAFDLTDVEEHRLAQITSIDIMGNEHSLDELAEEAGTIPYELLTSLGSRYHRQYIYE